MKKIALLLLLFSLEALGSTTTTPNMSLILPVPGTEAGPVWAQRLNTAFSLIDSHDHTSGHGTLIPTSGLNINADLQLGNYNLVNPRSAMFTNQSATLASSADKNNVYVTNGDLYFNNSSGTAVQITTGSSVNTSSAGNISGMGSTTAAVTYNGTTKDFTFTQSSGVTANVSGGTIRFHENVGSANAISMKPPTSLASAYTMTLPAALPAANSILTMDTTGVLGTSTAFVPAGAIMAYGGSSAPMGWFICDGSSILKASYAALYSALGDAYGTADGTHFNIPDFRGRFLRGQDQGTLRDLDALTRTAMNTGGATGDAVGSIEAGALASHAHSVSITDPGHTHSSNGVSDENINVQSGMGATVNGSSSGLTINSNTTGITASANSTGGSETRPLNAYVNYIVKY